ncbi:MAG: DegV family protein [Firmicutes bacterium]|nr:DegV family protein [Bacillota bacterium]HXL05261.1 DegV family protein [Bacillota bacterium]
MQIVTDYGADISTEQLEGLEVHYLPLMITIDGKIYRSGVDITPDEFYELQANAKEIPTTSQPSPGDFADLYRSLAKKDPDILSIHISSGLSGTINAARIGADMTPEANVEIYDTKTLSAAQGWHVEMAAKAVRAGWDKPRILSMLKQVTESTETLFTLSTLKYLIHGGRINHLKGLLASLLNIKPVIGVEKAGGTYVNRGQARTITRAIDMIADIVVSTYPLKTAMRVQILHSQNPQGEAYLKEQVDKMFECNWLSSGPIAPALGAHTGRGLVGIAFAPKSLFPQVP